MPQPEYKNPKLPYNLCSQYRLSFLRSDLSMLVKLIGFVKNFNKLNLKIKYCYVI